MTTQQSVERETFVLDASVFLHDPRALDHLRNCDVVIPFAVIEQLDQMKKLDGTKGMNSRRSLQYLDDLRRFGSFREGIKISDNQIVKILSTVPEIIRNISCRFDPEILEHQVLAVANYLHRQNAKKTILLSKDLHMRVKANILGIKTMDFVETEKNDVLFDNRFKGYRNIDAPEGLIKDCCCNGSRYPLEKIFSDVDGIDLAGLMANEFVIMANGNRKYLGRYDGNGDLCRHKWEMPNSCGIWPKNIEQIMAYHLLTDPSVQVVTLTGKAGTGKTMLALLAGLSQTSNGKKMYEKILFSRPIISIGNDLGYLSGDKEDKLSSWMKSCSDNLYFILSRAESMGIKRKKKNKSEDAVQLEALTFIRGRSICGRYYIVDEAQNLTPFEVKTIISRAGEGTKFVLLGDPGQIDNPYVDAESNGLTHAVRKLSPLSIHGHITLLGGCRSNLADVAASYL
ncbi:MAG: PhoH family protein [Candidatus Moranbacteria bacterium GW2011_GWE2_35_2-]|nr:MAG: PhoH family protein [Candidatus Moranbacteria bacterium GW2011_GWE2_35_2-]KKQ06805.1 MAG: PhoH family protein [Candidatus Moranbacteria bacterium GW2011_GWF1_36_4]KKQ22881.1 MAG: PhoH family protein [Candidatus Moranbacteria bacterium GW2011_GWF2_37_11]KKQ29239.1 MAG: PhoH family protein [Candidatus Moranbacteria bacterium GW2011_GWD1_37_17]KKQ30888.1 MAG: PhoH family protein [Candidatus Moranbacteria bacterium GW2011_GWE1_37_24]KKQ46958.1 MAG: PhoH family protein [Candidatus Moranbact